MVSDRYEAPLHPPLAPRIESTDIRLCSRPPACNYILTTAMTTMATTMATAVSRVTAGSKTTGKEGGGTDCLCSQALYTSTVPSIPDPELHIT